MMRRNNIIRLGKGGASAADVKNRKNELTQTEVSCFDENYIDLIITYKKKQAKLKQNDSAC